MGNSRACSWTISRQHVHHSWRETSLTTERDSKNTFESGTDCEWLFSNKLQTSTAARLSLCFLLYLKSYAAAIKVPLWWVQPCGERIREFVRPVWWPQYCRSTERAQSSIQTSSLGSSTAGQDTNMPYPRYRENLCDSRKMTQESFLNLHSYMMSYRKSTGWFCLSTVSYWNGLWFQWLVIMSPVWDQIHIIGIFLNRCPFIMV